MIVDLYFIIVCTTCYKINYVIIKHLLPVHPTLCTQTTPSAWFRRCTQTLENFGRCCTTLENNLARNLITAYALFQQSQGERNASPIALCLYDIRPTQLTPAIILWCLTRILFVCHRSKQSCRLKVVPRVRKSSRLRQSPPRTTMPDCSPQISGHSASVIVWKQIYL